MRNLYLIEFYTTNPETGEGGWDINFAWVYGTDKFHVKSKLAKAQGKRFDCIISCDQHAEVTPLAGSFQLGTPDANLFIIN